MVQPPLTPYGTSYVFYSMMLHCLLVFNSSFVFVFISEVAAPNLLFSRVTFISFDG